MPRLTPDQENAVYARNGSLVLSAAAGSGKTAVLTERVVERLLDPVNPLPPDRLLVVTFTKAAASEMKTRIREKLLKRRSENPENTLIASQLVLFNQMQVSTIHSFCTELLRSHYTAAGLDPDFKVAEDAAVKDLENRAADQVLEEFYQEESPDFHALCEFLCRPGNDSGLVDTVKTLRSKLMAYPFPEDWLENSLRLYDPSIPVEQTVWAQTLLKKFAEDLDYCLDLARRALSVAEQDDELEKKYSPALREDVQTFSSLLDMACRSDWNSLCECLPGGISFSRLGPIGNKYSGTGRDLIKGLRDEYKDICKGFTNIFKDVQPTSFRQDIDNLAPLMGELSRLTLRFMERFALLKRERGWLDFDDLEHFALNILYTKENGERVPSVLARELSGPYGEILVDEYQDCNEAQDMIFRAVSGEFIPGQGHLFVVGDIKQSVYGFRGANPSIFLNRMKNAAPFDGSQSPALITLASNFRSSKGVVDSINFLFDQLMTAEFGGVDYTHGHRLEYSSGLLPSSENQPDTQVCLFDPGENPLMMADYHAVAEMIRSLVDSKALVNRKVNDVWELHPVRYEDIAVLMRSISSEAPELASVLEKEGISCTYEAPEGFFEAREIQTFVSLLQVIDNPSREISLLSYLLSPLGGFTPDDVSELRVRYPGESLYSALVLAGDDGVSEAAELLEKLKEYRALSAVYPAGKLIRELFRMTCYPDMMLSDKDGERRRGNLQLLLDYASAFSEKGADTLTDYLRFLNRLKENSQNLEGARAGEENSGSIRIMSIHKSKGLQFPVCIVAGLGKKFNKIDLRGDTCLHTELGISGTRVRNDGSSRKVTLPQEAVKFAKNRDLLEEELRLLYVAATRAESRLIFTVPYEKVGSDGKQDNKKNKIREKALTLPASVALPACSLRSAGTFSDWMLSALLRHPDAITLRRDADTEVRTLPTDSRISFVRMDLSLLQEQASVPITPARIQKEDPSEGLKERLSWEYPHQDAIRLPTKVSVTQLVSDAPSVPDLIKPDFRISDGFSAAEKGTFLHRFLENTDYRRALEDPEAELKRLTEMGFFTQPEAECISVQKVRQYMSTPLVRKMMDSPRFYREFRFLRYQSASELPRHMNGSDSDEKIAVQGIVDCIYGDESHLVCVDYKTDRVTDVDAFLAHYTPQLSLYKDAVEEALETPVTACLLYSFSLHRVFCVRGDMPPEGLETNGEEA